MKLIVGFTLMIMQISFTRAFHLNYANDSGLTIQDPSSPDGELNSYNNSSYGEEITDDNENSDKTNIEEAIKEEIDRLARDIIMLFYKLYKELTHGNSNADENAAEFDPNNSFKPPPNATDLLEFLKKEVREIREAIKELKDSLDISESIKIRLALLEKAMEQLQKIFDDKNAELIFKLQEMEKFLELLASSVNEIKDRLDKLQQHINELQTGGPTSAQSAIISDVVARDYQSALKKLQELEGELKKNVNYVVHKVYNNKAGNFDLVQQFGDASKNTTISLAIYQALSFEMESNGNKNYLQIFRLINSLKRNIVDNKSALASERKEAEDLKKKLHSVVREIIYFKLIEALPAENYNTLAELSDKIYMNYPVLFSEVFSQAVKQTFEKIKAPSLIMFFINYKYQPQSVFAYSALFNEFKGRKKLDDSSVVTLAFGLKKALDSDVDSDAYIEGHNLKNALPKSVRVLAFSNRVCFRNVRNNEYMYAATDGYKYDSSRRQVFSWVPGERVNNGYWIVERVKDKYLIKNSLFKEYLYTAVDDYNYNTDRRRVFTWVPGPVDGQFYWTFEPSGNNMYVKSAYYNEYLLADDEAKFSDDRRYVFSWRWKTKTKDSLWEVQNCS